MPFSLRIEAGVVVGIGSGELTLDDALAGAKAVWENPDFRGKPLLWDFRSAQLELDPESVRKLAKFILKDQPAPPPARVAIVTSRNVDFGMARMFEALREAPPTEVRIFRDYGEAAAWARETDRDPGH